MIRTAIITLSDKGSIGERIDESGPVIREMLSNTGAVVEHYEVLPDDTAQLIGVLTRLADSGTIDLILTTGGTGVAPRDITPEATRAVIDRELPGMAEAMRAESLKKTPHAMISRAIAGIRNRTLIVNLPGSPRAARENLAVILPALSHVIEKIKGDPSDCGSR
jgi:molybdenum cofactor synthesis domain-containing protein